MGMLWWAAQKFDFQEIRHGFFVRGHSENESDSIHSRIEATSKHVNVYTTPQWATIIQSAKKSKPHYLVTEMIQEDFLDFKGMSKQFTNMNKTTERDNINFLLIRMYSVRKGDPCVQLHYHLNQPTTQMNLFQSGRRSVAINVDMTPFPLYSGQLCIDNKIYKDLGDMCERGIIPKAYHAFYKSLKPKSGEPTDKNSDTELEDEA